MAVSLTELHVMRGDSRHPRSADADGDFLFADAHYVDAAGHMHLDQGHNEALSLPGGGQHTPRNVPVRNLTLLGVTTAAGNSKNFTIPQMDESHLTTLLKTKLE